MTMPGGTELIIILFIVMLLFGAKRLPGLANSIGTSLRELRKSARDEEVVESEDKPESPVEGG